MAALDAVASEAEVADCIDMFVICCRGDADYNDSNQSLAARMISMMVAGEREERCRRAEQSR